MKKRSIKDDLRALSIAFFENLRLDTDCEFGSIGLDAKRPFGNSNVERSILEIIGWKRSKDEYGNFKWDDYEDDDGDLIEDVEEYARDLYYKYLLPNIISIGAKNFNIIFEEDRHGTRKACKK